jgi:[ribosomal protein S5]-alanine N-acetyltransferase
MTAGHATAYLYRANRVALRRITRHDKDEFIRLARASAELFDPWIYAPATAGQFDSYLERFGHDAAAGLLVCLRENHAIAGFINISEIVRGPYQRATLGYGVFAPEARRGYMSEAFGLVFRFAFDDLGLHRLEADIQPGNDASINLVKRLGFQKEGFSAGFACIQGEWKDHERWAITSDMVMELAGANPAG